jgi:hypothetical protein
VRIARIVARRTLPRADAAVAARMPCLGFAHGLGGAYLHPPAA